MSRDLALLHPKIAMFHSAFQYEMRKAGIDYIITCTYRTCEEQDALYACGRTAPGQIVTNAKGGQSAHNVCVNGKPAACAFDIVIMNNGKPDWNADHPAWQSAGNIGKIVGLDWAGFWKQFREYPHFQLKDWRDIQNGRNQT